jgi:hypothetical protein
MVDLKSDYDRKVHSLEETVEKQRTEIVKLRAEIGKKKAEGEASKVRLTIHGFC